jgi:hypothetical protein
MYTILKDIDPNTNASLQLEILDRTAFETIQRLCKAGVLSFNKEKAQSLYQSQVVAVSHYEEQKKHLERAQNYMNSAERKERMASLLIEGHFYEEALPSLIDILSLSIKSFAALTNHEGEEKKEISIETLQNELVIKGGLPAEVIQITKQLKNEAEIWDKEKVLEIFKKVQSIYQFVNHAIHKLRLDCAA